MSNCCIRGAITINEDTKAEVWDNTEYLLKEIIKQNNIEIDDIINIIFTCTRDISSAYPAVAARKIGIVDAALMCQQELYVEGSLPMCIRAMLTIETNKTQKEMRHVYLKGATVLRPDIVKDFTSVAIDGPAGSGKSTVAKIIAKKLGFIYVDTGAMYRAVGLYCIENKINCEDVGAVSSALDYMDIKIELQGDLQIIYLNGRDVTSDVRTQQVADAASAVAKIRAVRERLVELQRNIAKKNNVVMDGRDIGSNVLPNSKYKIYMDADVAERAKRRCNELKEKGIEHNFYKIMDDIIKRDKNDKQRECNPLIVAEDAIVMDTTDKSIEDVTKEIIDIIKNR